jgi:ABC-2 type transport system ATP-binding protein
VGSLTEVARYLHHYGIPVEDIGLRRPSLDDVFLRLTGRRTEEEPTAQEPEFEGSETEGAAA